MSMATTMNSTPVLQAPTRQRPWWLTLISGILALIIGSVLLWSPAKTKMETYLILIVFLGVYWIVEGIFDIVEIFMDHSMWGWKLFIGLISISVGVYIVMYPLATAVALPKIFVLALGVWGLIYGISLLVMAFKGSGWGSAILGILGIIFGFALTVNYYVAGMGLAMLWTSAAFAVVGGIVLIVKGFRQRSA
jgi:uncharacterized membrane protein HdeD (DUF308 family)